MAGKYLYVYGNMDDDGFYEGEIYNRRTQALRLKLPRGGDDKNLYCTAAVA